MRKVASEADSLPRWSRLSILDLLVLATGYALALALFFPKDEAAEYELNVELAVTTFISGGVVSGPLVLLSQWALRGRRTSPSVGEWLWIFQAGLSFVGLSVNNLLGIGLPLLPCWLVAELLLSMMAVVVLIARAVGDSEFVSCKWTDRFGAVICALPGPWFIVILCLHPIEIVI